MQATDTTFIRRWFVQAAGDLPPQYVYADATCKERGAGKLFRTVEEAEAVALAFVAKGPVKTRGGRLLHRGATVGSVLIPA